MEGTPEIETLVFGHFSKGEFGLYNFISDYVMCVFNSTLLH